VRNNSSFLLCISDNSGEAGAVIHWVDRVDCIASVSLVIVTVLAFLCFLRRYFCCVNGPPILSSSVGRLTMSPVDRTRFIVAATSSGSEMYMVSEPVEDDC